MTYDGPDRRKKTGTILDRSDYNYSGGNTLRTNKAQRRQSTITPDEIFHIRNGLELTQKEMGSALGVSATTVYQWERGERKPSPMAEKAIRELSNRNSASDII